MIKRERGRTGGQFERGSCKSFKGINLTVSKKKTKSTSLSWGGGRVGQLNLCVETIHSSKGINVTVLERMAYIPHLTSRPWGGQLLQTPGSNSGHQPHACKKLILSESSSHCNYDIYNPASPRGPGTGPRWDFRRFCVIIPVLSSTCQTITPKNTYYEYDNMQGI